MAVAMTGRKILITGVTGMMGRALALALAPANTVYGVARFTNHALQQRLRDAGVHCLALDLADADVAALPQDADLLLHFAVAWPAETDAAGSVDFNGYLVGRLLERLPNLKQFVIGSTVAVCVGGDARYDLTEATPAIPAGVYGTSKLIGDVIATHVARKRNLPGAILRYWFPFTDDPNVPQDYYQSLVQHLRDGRPFVISPDDAGCQQPIFIDDLVRITMDSLRFAAPDPFVLNVAGHEKLTHEQIVTTLGEVFAIAPHIQRDASEAPTLLTGSYDLTRLADTCGLGHITFRQGLQRLRRNLDPSLS